MTPAPSALSVGPRLSGTLDDLARPSKEMVWRHLRALRHQPPGRASRGERRRVFGAALEQAQQLFTAASVHYASRPILMFYGLSQAGRAVAACSTKAGTNDWRLSGHGIDVPGLDQRPKLMDLTIGDKGKGSFTQLAPLMLSGSLPDGAPLGQIWITIPDLARTPLVGNGGVYLPTLRLDHLSEDGRPEFSSWIGGLPPRFGAPFTEAEFIDFCSSYPTLAGSTGRAVSSQQPLPDQDGRSMKVRRAWTLPDTDNPGEFYNRHTRPYLGDDGRYIFPSSEVIHTHFTRCWRGGPFCSPSRCWPGISPRLGRLTSTWTSALMRCPSRHFLIEHLLPARSSCSMPSAQ
jgi:hypothetical protein